MASLDPETLRTALERWDGTSASVLQDREVSNRIFRFERDGEPLILRLTSSPYRTFAQCDAELEFVRHLDESGVRVAAPVASKDGLLVEDVGGLAASVFRWAPGRAVTTAYDAWAPPLFEDWGRALARLHTAATTFEPSIDDRRWEWDEEQWVRDADSYFTDQDEFARDELAGVLVHVRAQSPAPGEHGMIHADLGPQNFHVADDGSLTVFDFGNCCRAWFAADIAIALSTIPRHDDYDAWRTGLLNGYRSERTLSDTSELLIPWFLRFRAVYVLLSRLWYFGPTPDDEQRAQLDSFRAAIERTRAEYAP